MTAKTNKGLLPEDLDLPYKKVLEKELIRFFEKQEVTIEELCVRLNTWRMKHGREPVRGTPFKGKDGRIYELKSVKEYRVVER